MTTDARRAEHRAFLNRYYGVSRSTYDATRRFYLLGRDRALDLLLDEPWSRLVEIGPGTGRNLARLHTRRPEARYGGVDACRAMLEVARSRCPWATLAEGFAEEADYAPLVGGPPDRVLVSYALSMMCDPAAALDRARRALAAGGRVVVVDFGDFDTIPRLLGAGLRAWLSAFHVAPVDLASLGAPLTGRVDGPGRYYTIAVFDATT